MNYAQVGGAVVVQEIIDGCQNEYLKEVQDTYSDRFFCMGMAQTKEEAQAVHDAGMNGIAVPGHRLSAPLHNMMPMFKYMEEQGIPMDKMTLAGRGSAGLKTKAIDETSRRRKRYIP